MAQPLTPTSMHNTANAYLAWIVSRSAHALKFVLFFMVILGSARVTTAQDIALKKFYGSPSNTEVANAVAEFPGGGFVFVGNSGSHSPTDQDAFLMRLDSNGAEVWTVFFGQKDDDYGVDVAVSTDGNILVGGYSQTIEGEQGDAFVAKIDATGTLLWQETFHLSGADQVRTLVPTPDGACLVTINGHWNGGNNARLYKLTEDGNTAWFREFSNPVGDAYISAMALAPDGTCVLGGTIGVDSLVWKVSADGQTDLWQVPMQHTNDRSVWVTDLAIDQMTGAVAAIGIYYGSWVLNMYDGNEGALQWRDYESFNKTLPKIAFTGTGELVTMAGNFVSKRKLDNTLLSDLLLLQKFPALYEHEMKDMSITASGNYVFAGRFTHAPSLGEDALILLTTNTLQKKWLQTYGEVGAGHHERAYSVRLTNDDGYVLAGTKNYETTGTDLHVVKTDAQGNVQWENHYGGPFMEEGRSVELLPGGGYLMAGHMIDATSKRIWHIVKTNDMGVPEWEKYYDFKNAFSVGWSQLVPLPKGGYMGIASGSLVTNNNSSLTRPLLVRVDEKGDTMWTKKVGNEPYAYFRGIKVLSSGHIAVTGHTSAIQRGVWMMLFSQEGTLLWEQIKGPTYGYGYGIAELPDSSLVFTGFLPDASGKKDRLYITRYTLDGDFLWEKYFDDEAYYYWPDVQYSQDGNLLLHCTMEPIDGSGNKLLLLKMTPEGDVIWRKMHVPAAEFSTYKSDLTRDGGLAIAGYGEQNHSTDFMLLKTTGNGTVSALHSPKNTARFQVAPQPSTGPVKLALQGQMLGKVVFRLYDPTGRLVLETSQQKASETLLHPLDLSFLPAGVYFWQADLGGQRLGVTWIKQ